MVEGKKDWVYLDFLDIVETMLSDEEKALVERTEGWIYKDRLLSNEDKAMIEAMLKEEVKAMAEREKDQVHIDRLDRFVEVKLIVEKGLNHRVNLELSHLPWIIY